jgi:CheY-like chemotaxis protein
LTSPFAPPRVGASIDGVSEFQGGTDAPGSRDNLLTPSSTMLAAGGGARAFRPASGKSTLSRVTCTRGSGAGPGIAPQRILAVDDDVTLQEVLTFFLGRAYEVRPAMTGADALARVCHEPSVTPVSALPPIDLWLEAVAITDNNLATRGARARPRHQALERGALTGEAMAGTPCRQDMSPYVDTAPAGVGTD